MKKLRLYDKFWDWAMPLTKEEVEIHNAEIAALQEHERILRAEAELREYEVAEAKARVALIEEENERQRKAALPFSTVARLEYGLQMSLGKKTEGERCEVTVALTLEETCEGGARREVFTVLKRATGSVIAESEFVKKSIVDFIHSRASHQLYVQPWLDGKLTTREVEGARSISGDCCTSVKFAGGKA